jgi:hypothetical protein
MAASKEPFSEDDMARMLIVDNHPVVISACRQPFRARGVQAICGSTDLTGVIVVFSMNHEAATKQAAIDAGVTTFVSKYAYQLVA